MTTTTHPHLTPGGVLSPGEHGFDDARRAWNAQVDLRPAAAVVARSVDDVRAAVAVARARGLRIATQATGHGADALPTLSDALLVRTALHRGPGDVVVDADAGTVRVRAGARWGQVLEVAAAHGMTVPHGSGPSVGAIGYLLGGGLSFYARAHGLAAGLVRRFEVVTADGEVRDVTAASDPDLFWALRGGGGAFGVVTAVEVEMLPYREVEGGALFFAADADPEVAERLLRAWRDATLVAPDSLTTTCRILRLPPLPEVPEPLRGRPVVCVDGVAVAPGAGDALIAALREVATPVLGGWGPMPAAAVGGLHGDPEEPSPGVADGGLVPVLDDAALTRFLEHAGPAADTPLAIAELRHLGGAMTRADLDAGAGLRVRAPYLVNAVAPVLAADGLPAARAAVDALRRDLATAPRRLMTFAEHDGGLAACVEPEQVPRLLATHRAVDPDALFVTAHLPS